MLIVLSATCFGANIMLKSAGIISVSGHIFGSSTSAPPSGDSLTNGLVLWYSFDMTNNGEALHWSNQGSQTTNVVSPTKYSNLEYPEWQTNGTLLIGMVGAQKLTNLYLTALNYLTVSAWVKPTRFPILDGEMRSFISSYRGSSSMQEGEFRLTYWAQNGLGPTNTFDFDCGRDGTFFRVYATNTYPTGVWYMVTATYDGTNAKIYVDGVLNNSISATTGVLQASRLICFGEDVADGGMLDYYQGGFDDARIYNRALTADEITNLYGHGYGFWTP